MGKVLVYTQHSGVACSHSQFSSLPCSVAHFQAANIRYERGREKRRREERGREEKRGEKGGEEDEKRREALDNLHLSFCIKQNFKTSNQMKSNHFLLNFSVVPYHNDEEKFSTYQNVTRLNR